MHTHGNTSRRRASLAVFCALVLLLLAAFSGYLAFGHSWNKTAASLDDTFGDMEGYSVILFEGLSSADGAQGAESSAGAGGADYESDDGGGQRAASSSQDASGAVAASDKASDNADADDAGADDAGADRDDQRGQGEEDLALAEGAALLASVEATDVDLASAVENYEEKGAEVLTLDVTDLDGYADGVMTRLGDGYCGIVSLQDEAGAEALQQRIDDFREAEADLVVVLASDLELYEGIEGADVVISVRDEGLNATGESEDGTLYVDSPVSGTVGVVVVSASDVISAKVLDTL